MHNSCIIILKDRIRWSQVPEDLLGEANRENRIRELIGMHLEARDALDAIGEDMSEFLMEERPEKIRKAMTTLVSLDSVLNIPQLHSWLQTYAYDNEKTTSKRKLGEVNSQNLIDYATKLVDQRILDQESLRALRRLHLIW